MLCLSRKRQESIWIEPDITITLLSVAGDRVRLGIDAPPGVRIFRTELLKTLCHGCYQNPCICLPNDQGGEWHQA